MGLQTNIYPPQTYYSLILYRGNGDHDQNIHYLCSFDIHLSTMYHMSVYDVTYKTLGHTHPGIATAEDMS